MFITACSNGGGGDSGVNSPLTNSTNLTGTVQKGTFIDGTILAQKVQTDGTLTDISASAKISSDGTYALKVSWEGLTLLTAQGHFYNEYTGKITSETISLYALLNYSKKTQANLNLFSSLEANRILDLMQNGASYADASEEAKTEMERVFGLTQDVNAIDLDIDDLNSSLKDENVNLLLLSATFLKMIEEETLEVALQQAPARVSPAPGQKFENYSQRFYGDFKKDGRVDGIFQEEWGKIIEDDEEKTMEVVGANLGRKIPVSVKVGSWAKRLRLTVSSPSYVFESGHLQEIHYDIGVTASNFLNLNASYTLNYNTIDGTAVAQSDYNATDGTIVLTRVNNSHTIIIPVIQQSEDDKDFTINFTVNNENLVIPNPNFHVTIPSVSDYNEASNVSVAQLLLNKISIDGYKSTISAEDDIVLIGSANSSVNLEFAYRAMSLEPYEYFIKVYALLGAEELLVLDDTLVTTVGVTGRYYWQLANLNVPVSTELKELFDSANNSSSPIHFKVIAQMRGDSTSQQDSADMPQFVQIGRTMTPHTLLTHSTFSNPLNASCQEVVHSSDVNFSASRLYASMDLEGLFQAEGMSNSVGIIYDNACVQLDRNDTSKQFDVSLLNGTGTLLDVVKTTIGGVEVEMETSGVTKTQLHVSKVFYPLPEEHSIHVQSSDGSVATRGESEITLKSDFHIDIDSDLSRESFNGSLEKSYIHARALPFYFVLNNFTLNTDGLRFKNSSIEYLFSYANRHTNNSELFSSPKNTLFDFTLDDTGIDTPSIGFNTTTFTSSFPKSSSHVGEFVVRVKNSYLQKSELHSGHDITVSYQQSCSSDTCLKGGKVYGAVEVNTTASTLYSDGSIVASKEGLLGKEVRWGSKGDKRVFSRKNDSDAKVYIGGFTLPTNSASQIGNFLLGSTEVSDDGLTYYSVKHQDVMDGKYLFAGINIGNTQNDAVNSLDDTQMSVLLGEGNSLEVTSNGYSKYYLRPSGVTGVFNNKGKIDNFSVYGYPMDLDSFKFRQHENILDDFTKINGSVAVNGKGNFNVLFENLELTCSGNFSGGKISNEHENIVLDAWSVDSVLTTIDFKNKNADVCSNSKDLQLGHVLKVAALKKRIGLNTFWSNVGIPFDSQIISARSNQFDGNSSQDASSDNGGYDVALQGLMFKSTTGGIQAQDWIESNVSFGLPFWGVQDMSVRLQNKTITSRAPSVVTAKGELYENGRLESQTNEELVSKIVDSYSYNIANDWANVIHFRLPVYYNATENTAKRPDFLGRKLSSDLIVLETDATVDYIRPDRTSMSFGASASTAELQGLKLHVDLNDPQSLRDIDRSLNRYLGIENALQDTVGVLVENINIGNRLLKDGMTLSMEETAYLSLKAAASVGVDPFEKVTELNAQLHAIPTTIKDRFMEIFSQKISRVLDQSYTIDISEKKAIIDDALREYEELVEYLNDINHTLATIPSVTSADMKEYIYENGFGSQECSYDNFTQKGFFKPIGEGNKAIANVNEKLQNFDMAKVRNISEKASDYTGLDADDLVSTTQKIQELSRDLDTLVNDLNSSLILAFNDDFCNGLSSSFENMEVITTNIDKAVALKGELQDKVAEILVISTSEDVENIIGELRNFSSDTNVSSLDVNMSHTVIVPVNIALDELTTNIAQNIPNIEADDMRRVVVSKIFEMDVVVGLNEKLTLKLQPVADEVNKLALSVFSGFDKSINMLLAKVSDRVNEILNGVTSKLDAIPLASGKMDGYAVFYGDTLAKLHVGSEFSVTGSDEDSSFGFNAALDIENDANNDNVGCGLEGSNFSSANVRAAISTRDITMPLGEKELRVDLILLGVTIGSNGNVKGIFGAIESKSGFDYDTFKLYNLGLATGIGVEETYLGAKASATMDALQLGVSFLVGQVCNREIISTIIPEAIDKFITIPNNRFNGALVFGEGQMPIYTNGCTLTVIARAKLGTWFLFGPPKTFGGIVGGGAFGKGLCIATLGGSVEVLAEKSGDTVKFQGKGWGAAGAGSCDSSWSSVRKSRKDSWCGTGDACFGASYDNGWSLEKIRTSAVH